MRTRLRFLLKERDLRGAVDEQVLSVYRDHGVVPKGERSDNFNKTPEDLSMYKLVLRGDVVVNKMKAWQGSIAVSDHRGIVSGDYLVCSTHSDADTRFLHHLLRSRHLIDEYALRSKGIRPSQWRLYWEDLADVEVDLPSITRQRAIADFLDRETARIDALITKKRRMIDTLEERWQTTMWAAVSGHLTFSGSTRDAACQWWRAVPARPQRGRRPWVREPAPAPWRRQRTRWAAPRCNRSVRRSAWPNGSAGPRRALCVSAQGRAG